MGTFSRLCAAVMVDEGEEFGVNLASTLKIGGFRFYPARDILVALVAA